MTTEGAPYFRSSSVKLLADPSNQVRQYCIAVEEYPGAVAAHYWSFRCEETRAAALLSIRERKSRPGAWGKKLVLFTRTVEDIHVVDSDAEVLNPGVQRS